MCNKILSIICSFALVKWCVTQHWTLINSEIEGYDGTHFTINQVFVFVPDGVLVWFQIGWEVRYSFEASSLAKITCIVYY